MIIEGTERQIIDRIRDHEGIGKLNEKEPPHVGGISFEGITLRAFVEWIQGEGQGKNNGVTHVRNLVKHPEVVDAFYHDYLKNAWHLPECLQYMYCDFYTNGQAHANRIIQRMVGVDDDGVWGSGTTRAVQAWTADINERIKTDNSLDNDLITEFHDQKLAHYESLKEINPSLYQTNIAGWKKRAMRLLGEHQQYFEDDEPVATAVNPEDMPDDQFTMPEELLATPECDAGMTADTPPAEDEPYHAEVVIESKIATWLASEVQAGYVLSAIIPADERFLIITEVNPAKVAELRGLTAETYKSHRAQRCPE